MKKLTILTVVTATLLTIGATLPTHAKAGEVKEGETTFYVVEYGDTLSKISEKYGVDFTVIHANNADKISDSDLIFAGQKLVVDGEGFDKTKVITPATPATDATDATATQVEASVEEVASPVEEASTPASAPVQEVTQSTNSAKEWIASKESSGNYDARNGRYVGRYQLDASYLNGDFSPTNQERVVEQYVSERYGSWENAQAFWLANGWY